MQGHKRILFFDLLRIICVFFVVNGHFTFWLFASISGILFLTGWSYMEIYPLTASMLAVYGLIIVSGAVMEYNYSEIRKFSEYKLFVLKRFFRLYPAYWMSLIFGLAIAGGYFNVSLTSLFLQFSGLFIFTQNGDWSPDTINIMGWFIPTIFFLYLLFPLLSKAVKNHPYPSMAVSLIITFVSRYILIHYTILPGWAPWRWFPLCNLFEFCLGIYIVRMSLYPKNSVDHPVIAELADFTFYIFIFHVVVIQNIIYFLDFHRNLYNFPILYNSLLCAEILGVSALAMILDKKLQKIIRIRLLL